MKKKIKKANLKKVTGGGRVGDGPTRGQVQAGRKN